MVPVAKAFGMDVVAWSQNLTEERCTELGVRKVTKDELLALASVAMVAIIPLVNVFSVAVLVRYASPEQKSLGTIVLTVVKNPLIWACAIGLAVNVLHLPLPKLWYEVADALGRSSLAIGQTLNDMQLSMASAERR